MDEQPKKASGGWHVLLVLLLRFVDSGLAPWMVVALFFLCALYIPIRNLNSKDTLAFLTKCGTFHGFVWLGWVIAFAELPILKWCLKREKQMSDNRNSRLEEENTKLRLALVRAKRGELTLDDQGK